MSAHRRGAGPPGGGLRRRDAPGDYSKITDRVLEGLAEWQLRPLDAVYAVPFIDVINVKIRDSNGANQPIAACI